MRSTSSGPRRRSASKLAVVAASSLLLLSSMGRAGETLTVEQIAERTHGAAVVKVDLTRDKAAGAVEVMRILRGLPADLKATPSWLGLCLPRRKVLRSWTIQYPKWSAIGLWRQALARGHYEALVLVEQYEGGHRPRCGVEAMQMHHTDLSKGYAEYTRKVEDVLRRRAATGKP